MIALIFNLAIAIALGWLATFIATVVYEEKPTADRAKLTFGRAVVWSLIIASVGAASFAGRLS